MKSVLKLNVRQAVTRTLRTVSICLLPLTDSTRGILSKPLFDRLPRGATVINVGRGGHLVQEDLLQALDEGKLSCAMLDVCEPGRLTNRHDRH